MHNKTAASRYYVQNIIGAPLYDPHIPPEHLATTEPVTNCLKETVGVENNVVYIIRDGRHWRCSFIGGIEVTECLKEVVWVDGDEVEIGDVNVRSLHGYPGCLRQSRRYWGGSIRKSLPIRARDVITRWNEQRCSEYFINHAAAWEKRGELLR